MKNPGTIRIRLRSALLAAVAASAALGPAVLRAQDAAVDDAADWNTLSLDAFAQMLGRDLPRPKKRPPELEPRQWHQRPQPRPGTPAAAELPEAPPAPAPGPVVLAAPAPPMPEQTASAAVPDQIPENIPDSAPAPVPVPPSPPPQADPPPPDTADTTAAPGDTAVAPLPPLAAVRTSDFDSAAFLADRRMRQEAWQQAAAKDRAAAAVELSRVLISQMLLPEARAFHLRARQDGLEHDPALHQTWRAMQIMLDVLQHGSSDTPPPENWGEAGLWRLAAQADKAGPGPATELTDAVLQLQNHAEPVISALLPKLFAVALKRGDLRVAEGLLRGAREATTLPGTPIYHLMMGQMALAYDMPQEAFDYFVRASEGRDISAQRARIALADLALLRKDPKLLPSLRDILSEGVNQWRHDHEALILRARLAQVAEDLGDIPLALDIMGKIRQDHAGTPEAILAHERGALALAAFAVAIEAREISLTTYLTTLREIEPFYRLDPVWPIARQALARAFSRAGLHVAAASEYVALQIDLRRVDAPTPPEAQRVEVSLNEAESWLEAFNEARARIALAREGLPRFEALQTRYARASLGAGVTGAAMTPVVLSEGDDLALLARSARGQGLTPTELSAHRAMAQTGTLTSQPAEALYAVLSAHEAGEAEAAKDYFTRIQAGPAGADFPGRQQLFTGLATPLPALQPMSQALADTLLGRSDAALTAARDLIARPATTHSATQDAAPTP